MSSDPGTYVIGASGYVGSALLGRFVRYGHSVTGTFNSDASGGEVQYDFWSDTPDFPDNATVVFAALVEQEDRPIAEFERRATELTRACSSNRFVYLSSDAVFGGDAGPYAEDEPTSAATSYGQRTERFEEIVRENCSEYCIVRPSYVYGYSSGTLDDRLQRTFEALRNGDSVAYFEDMFKSPVEVNQLAEVVRRVARSEFCGTIHVGGPRMSVRQFHRRAARAFGAPTERIEPDTMPAESPYPRDSSLDSSKLASEFRLQPADVVESLTYRSIEDILDS